jgi:RNA polymerase sigma-70 factor (ECF subfamily)
MHDTAIAEDLTSRFERDVIPLLAGLYRHALRMTRDRVEAEDLLQEAMAKAYGHFHTFRQETNINAWLHRILMNTYISDYRKKKRRPAECPSDGLTDWQLAAEARHSSSGLRSAEDQALDLLPDRRITNALESLPDQFRMAVYYADVEGFRIDEIAELTDSPVGTVMSRLHRGRRRLRRLLADVARERGYDLDCAA